MNLIESLLIITNIFLIILAIFLLIKLRKSIVKPEEEFEPGAYLKKEKETDLTGIADIKPEEFNPERFDLKKDFFTPTTPTKTIPVEMGSTAIKAPATLSLDAVVNDAGILETDELELEDELPEEFALSQVDNTEIPQPVKQEEKPEEEFVVPSEHEIPVPGKEKEKLKEEFAVTPEPEIPVPEKEEEKAEKEFTVTPEPEIPVPGKEEEKTEEEFVVTPEPEITVPEKEEEKTEEEFVVTPEPEIPAPEKEEEKPKEEFVVPPELKLFSLEDTKKHEENTAPPTPEVKTMPPVKEEVKPVVKLAAPPELKLFTLAEKPGTLTEGLSGETSIQEQKVKKTSKRKSLF